MKYAGWEFDVHHTDGSSFLVGNFPQHHDTIEGQLVVVQVTEQAGKLTYDTYWPQGGVNVPIRTSFQGTLKEALEEVEKAAVFQLAHNDPRIVERLLEEELDGSHS